MACGCADNACNCVVQGINGVVVTGSGSVADPYLITPPTETTFAATSTGGAILITPGGTSGHTPDFELVLDPASPAALSQGPDGLSVACCSSGGEGEFATGMMMDFAGPVAPVGWVLADGTEYNTGDLPDLFALIGTTYGSSGAGLFMVPDASGRATYGVGTNTDVDAIADNDGMLVGARTPSHVHSGPSHSHSVSTTGSTTSQSTTASGANNAAETGVAAGINPTEEGQLEDAAQAQPPNTAVNILIVDAAANPHAHDIAHSHTTAATGTTGAAGTGATGLTATPFLVVNKIIKT